MKYDISDILKDWPYESGKVTVRRIRGADGCDKIQLRLDLGLMQMEATGRPDGERPHGCESLLDHYKDQLRLHKETHGTAKGYALDEQACELLRAETVMYYHRYLAEFVLEDYQAVVRDTMRNLDVMDFCNTYAAELSDREILEQYRPYVLMMCGRARAQAALRDRRPKSALEAVRNGIEQIEAFHRRYDPEDAEERSELAILRALAKEIKARIPVDPLTRLRQKLQKAVAEEHYEEAASLRDRIRRAGRRQEAAAESEPPSCENS